MPTNIISYLPTAAGSQIPDSLKQRALPPTPDQVFDTTTTTKTHNPLKKTQGVFTLPLRRQKSPLIVSSEVPKDESCLDSDIKRVSATLPLHEPMPETLPVGSSLTLPSRNQKLVLKSITQSAAPCPYQRLESTRSRSSASSACLSPTTPPPLPPRTLIDPDRVVDFSAVIKGVKGDGGVSGEGDSVEATAVCLSCGREIRGLSCVLEVHYTQRVVFTATTMFIVMLQMFLYHFSELCCVNSPCIYGELNTSAMGNNLLKK